MADRSGLLFRRRRPGEFRARPGAMGPIMQQRAERMYVLPGNHESEADIARFCREFGFHDFHGRTMRDRGLSCRGARLLESHALRYTGRVQRTGIEGAPTTIFWARSVGLDLPYATQRHRARSRRRRASISEATRSANLSNASSRRYFYCGHIHEAAGQQATLGRTEGWNVGKRGQLLELTPLVK